MKNRTIVRWLAALCLVSVFAPSVRAAPGAALPTPVNMSCQGWEKTTVVVSWKDAATDETGWKVERRIDGGAWSLVGDLVADATQWRDTGVDPTLINREYRVRSYRAGDSSYSSYSEICNNRRVVEDGNFRVFYGLRGTDACPLIDGENACTSSMAFAQQQLMAGQGSRAAFARAGFMRDAGTPGGGLDRIPINIAWCDGGGCAGGVNLGMSPYLIEMPFDHVTRVGDPAPWVINEHELFHFLQFQYDGLVEPDAGWVIEGQARSSQDKFCLGAVRSTALCFDDIDTGYAGYVGEVNGYLGYPNIGLRLSAYRAALFWTYMTEKFGTNLAGDQVEAGTNFLARFWEASAATPGRDAVANINDALTANGFTQTFRTAYKDFMIANYAKDLTGTVDSKYRYADMAQPGGTYDEVQLEQNLAMWLGDTFLDVDETVNPWGGRYYQFRPDSDVPVLPITVTQDSTAPLFYTVLGIRNGSIIYEHRSEARNLELSLVNQNFDKVLLMVAGLEASANYRVSVNGVSPTLRLVRPSESDTVFVGNPSAPDRFLAVVEVVDAAGVPLPGQTPDQFRFTIGSRAVPTESIVAAASIQGQVWFVMNAVTQTFSGPYTLRATYQNALTSTNELAVLYLPRTADDSVLIIDRSGSMHYGDKITATQQAAKLYVDSWKEGDRIAVESFDHVVAMPMTMREWTTDPPPAPIGSRETAQAAIDALVPGGLTAIGDAVMAGWEELKARGITTHVWSLVLLSDGLHNAGTKSFDDAIHDVRNSDVKKPMIHTVAVGPDADRLKMYRAAVETRGTYHFIAAPADGTAARSDRPALVSDPMLPLRLDEKYRFIATQQAEMQQFFSAYGPAVPNSQIEEVVIPVDAKADEMLLTLSWLPRLYAWELRDPSGMLITPTLSIVDRQSVWRVSYPAVGTWRLVLYGSNSSDVAGTTLPPYFVQGALRSRLALRAFVSTPIDQLAIGAPAHLVAFLHEAVPVLGATVTATVVAPDDSSSTVLMHDDGLHGDGAANDGVYGGDFLGTYFGGSYQVTVRADGTSPTIGSFRREALLSFHIEADEQPPDTDQDRLPDPWEKRWPCVLAGKYDAESDPDRDGSSNYQEYVNGTDPCDPDTDDDGEADGTDKNPRVKDEGRTQPPYTVAWPGNGRTWVKYSVDPNLLRVRLLRRVLSTTVASRLQVVRVGDEYEEIDVQEPPLGVITDTTSVVNDAAYCYLLVSETVDGQSSVTPNEACTVPRVDYSPPHGGVAILGNPSVAFTPTVRLRLIASDSVSPHTVEDHGGELMTPPSDGESGVTQMMISNRADFAGANWQAYAGELDWKLDFDAELPAVYVRYRDGAGNESIAYAATVRAAAQVYVPLAVK